MITTSVLAERVTEARARSLELVEDLDDDQLQVPLLPTLNPILWELCHLAYFQELWVLREGAGQEPCRPDVDELFDSINIAHETRWRLDLPLRQDAIAYVTQVRDRVLDLLAGSVDEKIIYYAVWSVCHEDMHAEALTCSRQTLGYVPPRLGLELAGPQEAEGGPLGDAQVPGGTFMLGASRDTEFCHDNEKWAHPVDVAPFAIARAAVCEGEFAVFVEEGGYRRQDLWSRQGWSWRQASQAEIPLYWRRDSGGDLWKRHFHEWMPLEPQRAMIHVCWYEADAFCRWSGRRLPTEVEWEVAAAAAPENDTITREGRKLPWGDGAPGASWANMDWQAMGPVDVGAHQAGESAFGCRQILGNVWEWTATTFEPYPDFVPDMYADYSQTSFRTRKVLRGGSWATRSRLVRNTWRNFFQPFRRDVFAGFRTCAGKLASASPFARA